MTAAERKASILEAALVEFAERGLDGASTEAIAARAGISQPYVFRLFGTKKELFKASVARCFRETLDTFQRAAEGKRGEEALAGFGDLVTYVGRVSGLPSQAITDFFAKGMLLNVIASMGLDHSPEPWAERLVDGCKE